MKIALVGYGKMGHMIEKIALSRGHEIVSIVDIDSRSEMDSAAFRSADVAIEFTSPQAAAGNVLGCMERGVKVVSGSTGWLKGEMKSRMQQLCKEEGKTLLWSSNFSVGVAIFRAVNRCLARIMNRFPEYDVTLEEVHHIHKLDAPSGTAITPAEQACEELDRKVGWTKGLVQEADGNITGTAGTPANLLRIDAKRCGEVPGIHTVTYDSPADLIRITHSAHTREGFALGAVLAAEFLQDHSGWLTIDDLFHWDI